MKTMQLHVLSDLDKSIQYSTHQLEEPIKLSFK